MQHEYLLLGGLVWVTIPVTRIARRKQRLRIREAEGYGRLTMPPG